MSVMIRFLAERGIDPVPHINILDIGAMDVGGDPWDPLVASGAASVIGFEPIEAECEKLMAQGKPGRKFLPYAVGDGQTEPFHLCNHAFTSSLLKPNHEVMGHFSQLKELAQVEKVIDMPTQRLDDIAELSPIDFVKLDTQGSEVTILENGQETLKNSVMVQSEASFVPLYHDQPLFAEVDQCMRRQGFLFNQFTGKGSRSFRPPAGKTEPLDFRTQWLWTDALFVRDFRSFDQLEPMMLLKGAIIAHAVYRGIDLAAHFLDAYDRRHGSQLAADYYEGIRLKLIT